MMKRTLRSIERLFEGRAILIDAFPELTNIARPSKQDAEEIKEIMDNLA